MQTGFSVSIIHTLNEARRAMTADQLVASLKDPNSSLSKARGNGSRACLRAAPVGWLHNVKKVFHILAC